MTYFDVLDVKINQEIRSVRAALEQGGFLVVWDLWEKFHAHLEIWKDAKNLGKESSPFISLCNLLPLFIAMTSLMGFSVVLLFEKGNFGRGNL